ncbi:hypothetical protein NPIL_116351 [Nephila pilipes]|uniref:Uncharacterized protein n=1 Tax=Nephila pilipes TaxID=299642 RepID=A0A8X6PWA0_NEPPI|nr:hypothetical protein NPIL_116351 [Nephila pilipes]
MPPGDSAARTPGGVMVWLRGGSHLTCFTNRTATQPPVKRRAPSRPPDLWAIPYSWLSAVNEVPWDLFHLILTGSEEESVKSVVDFTVPFKTVCSITAQRNSVCKYLPIVRRLRRESLCRAVVVSSLGSWDPSLLSQSDGHFRRYLQSGSSSVRTYHQVGAGYLH